MCFNLSLRVVFVFGEGRGKRKGETGLGSKWIGKWKDAHQSVLTAPGASARDDRWINDSASRKSKI